jgi:hypothetical protein
VLVQHLALAGAVEQQAVIAAARRCHRRGEVHVGEGGVVAIGQNQQRAHVVGMAYGRDETRGQRGAFEPDPQRLDGRIHERECSRECVGLFAEGRDQARIDRSP